MSLAPSAQYPAQTDVDPAYPHGKARNAGTFQDGSGTPLEKAWLNDLWGFEQALLAAAGITPSGTPDAVGASDYLDAVTFVADRQAAAYAAGLHLTSFAAVSLNTAPPTTIGLAAVFDPTLNRVLLIKGGASGTHVVVDDGFGIAVADCGTVTTARDGALDPVGGVVAVVGTGGNFAARSVNFGTSWSDAASPPTARDSVVWDATHSLFIAGRVGQADVYTSPTGATWTSRALSGTGQTRVVVNSAGVGLIGRGTTGPTIAFDRSTNGTAWASSGSTLPDVAAASSPASLVALGGTFFAAARWGGDIRLHSSPDGLVWTLIATIAPNATTGSPTLWADASTGTLYEAHTVTTNAELRCSRDGGLTWFGPARTRVSLANLQAVGGRVWANDLAVTRCTAVRLPP